MKHLWNIALLILTAILVHEFDKKRYHWNLTVWKNGYWRMDPPGTIPSSTSSNHPIATISSEEIEKAWRSQICEQQKSHF